MSATQYEKMDGGTWTRLINPARRAKKATGLKGRQWVKYRKAQRRAERAKREIL